MELGVQRNWKEGRGAARSVLAGEELPGTTGRRAGGSGSDGAQVVEDSGL